jgi:hypothetical protein
LQRFRLVDHVHQAHRGRDGNRIIVDAVLVRMIVVPAAMRLMGSANWWAPKPLRGIYRRYGMRDELQLIARELTDARSYSLSNK